MLDQSMLYHFGDSYKELKYGWSIVDDSPIPTIVDCTIGFPVSSLSPNSLKEVTLPNHGFFEQLKYTGGKNKPEDIGVVKKILQNLLGIKTPVCFCSPKHGLGCIFIFSDTLW